MTNGAVALVAMGKLGGREMTATSDVDLILLYDFDEAAPASSGARPLYGSQYYTRLTQRLVAALSAPTAEGTLYAVDFRLRPSGKSGPLATHIDAFAAYQAKDAWTWERMALTRARIVAGDRKLAKRASQDIRAILTARRDAKKIVADIREMRAMVEEAKGGEGAWDLKQAPGGLVDIEFIAQALLLVNAHRSPALIATETDAVLTAAAADGLLSPADADLLLPTLKLYQSLIQITRLCLDTPFDPETAPRALLERLAQAGELPDFATLDGHVRATETAVREVFERLIGTVLEKPPA
jgi:glutamate-ammonia-ligase adenylyltransferase